MAQHNPLITKGLGMVDNGSHPGDYAIESVENALRTLLMLHAKPSFRAVDVATELNVARSTALRMVATLEKHDFLRRNPDKSYSAGLQLVELGLAVVGGADFGTQIQPILARLAQHTGETVHFLMREGDEVVFVAGAEGTHVVQAVLRVGERLPAHTTAAGRLLLATLTDAELAAIYDSDEKLSGGTNQAIHTLADLRADLASVRRLGRAINSSHSELGLLATSRLVVDAQGRARGAISVSGPEWRLAPRVEELDRIVATTLDALNHRG